MLHNEDTTLLQQDLPQRPIIDSCARRYRAEVWIMFREREREREMGMLGTQSAAAAAAAAAEWSAIGMSLNLSRLTH